MIFLSKIVDFVKCYHVQIIVVLVLISFFAIFRYIFYKRLEHWIYKMQKHIKPIHFTKRVIMFWQWFSSKRKKGLHYKYDFRRKK